MTPTNRIKPFLGPDVVRHDFAAEHAEYWRAECAKLEREQNITAVIIRRLVMALPVVFVAGVCAGRFWQ